MTYRFVGTLCDIGGIRLSRFGQKVELDPKELARKTLVIPEKIWQEIGFSDQEVRRYHTPAAQMTAPADFIAKRAAAWCYCQTGELPPQKRETTAKK